MTAIDDLTGRVLRTRTLPRFYGVPIVAYDGTTAGVSGDARSLVVAGYGPFPGEPGTTSLRRAERQDAGCAKPDRTRRLVVVRRDLAGRSHPLPRATPLRGRSRCTASALDVRPRPAARLTRRRPARAGVRDGWAAGDAGDGAATDAGPTRSTRAPRESRSSTRSTRRGARRSASTCPCSSRSGRQLVLTTAAPAEPAAGGWISRAGRRGDRHEDVSACARSDATASLPHVEPLRYGRRRDRRALYAAAGS